MKISEIFYSVQGEGVLTGVPRANKWLQTDASVDLRLTHTCYDPDERGRACGECDACLLRLKGFAEAGIADPIEYR